MGFFEKIVSSFRGKEPEPPIARKIETNHSADFHSSPSNSVNPSVEVREPQTPRAPAPQASLPVVVTNGNNSSSAVQVTAPVIGVTQTPQSPAIFDDLNDDDFDAVFDAAFDNAFGQTTGTRTDAAGFASPQENQGEPAVQHNQAEIADLFANIAANYATPIKNFIFELKRGVATKDWIEICLPAMRSISQAAKSMDLLDAAGKMANFEEALLLAESADSNVLKGEECRLILICYDELVAVMPQAFTIGEEEQQREGIIINSLLKQIPDVGKVTLDKMYAAGLTTLNALFLARKEELAAATGIPVWLSERICNKFQEYKESLQSGVQLPGQAGKRARLRELANVLQQQTEGYERAASNEWADQSAATEKRRLRQERLETCHKINIVLAELGAVELVKELQKLSFERRIESLQAFLANSNDMN